MEQVGSKQNVILSYFLYKMYGKQMNMADFSIVGQIYQFQLIGTIKYYHINSTDIILKLFNDFQIFTAFTGGSGGSF